MDLGHWTLAEGVVLDETTFGFIYEITNKVTGKKYIGKKQCFMRIKRSPLKGKTRHRISQAVSAWKTYTSSSNEVNDDIRRLGKESFEFKILRACGSKWALAYFEMKEQVERDVLLREDFYNGQIRARVGSPPKQELDNFKNRL